jgi:hypothetical protein
MDAPLSTKPLGVGWMSLCGVIVAVAALKEIAARIAESPVAVAPKRPSLLATLVAGFLVKEAVGQIGRDALGLPADR